MSRHSRASFRTTGILALASCGLLRVPSSLHWLKPALAAPAAPATVVAKRTERVAMRDGTHLATDIYLPTGSATFPTVLARTPYNKDGLAGFAEQATRRGYALVVQDTRG